MRHVMWLKITSAVRFKVFMRKMKVTAVTTVDLFPSL